VRRNLFFQRKLNPIARDRLNPPEKYLIPVAQLVNLPRLRPQHPPQVMCTFSQHHCRPVRKLFNEESAPHAGNFT
jgi:hypothetical protein